MDSWSDCQVCTRDCNLLELKSSAVVWRVRLFAQLPAHRRHERLRIDALPRLPGNAGTRNALHRPRARLHTAHGSHHRASHLLLRNPTPENVSRWKSDRLVGGVHWRDIPPLGRSVSAGGTPVRQLDPDPRLTPRFIGSSTYRPLIQPAHGHHCGDQLRSNRIAHLGTRRSNCFSGSVHLSTGHATGRGPCPEPLRHPATGCCRSARRRPQRHRGGLLELPPAVDCVDRSGCRRASPIARRSPWKHRLQAR